MTEDGLTLCDWDPVSAIEEALEVIGDPKTAPPEAADDGHAPLHSIEDRIPKFNLRQLKLVRDAIRKLYVQGWKRPSCDNSFIDETLFPGIRAAVPKRVSTDVLRQTVQNHLSNRPLSKGSWELLATRLAGNVHWMQYEPLTSIQSLQHCQWAVLETLEAHLIKPRSSGRLATLFEYRVRTGQWAGAIVKKFLALNFLPIYGDCLGLGQWRWKKQPRLYTNMNLFAYLAPANRMEQLTFGKIYGTPSCKELNKFYAKGRNGECIHGFNHTCWYCPRGLHGDANWQCKFATHQWPWQKKKCDVCGKEHWFYADWLDNHPCVLCSEGRSR